MRRSRGGARAKKGHGALWSIIYIDLMTQIMAFFVIVWTLEHGARATQTQDAPAGLLRGLADARLAMALREMHGDPARAWTVGELASKAALSRSAFFERFSRAVGLAPMEYLVAWRMAMAKDILRHRDVALDEVAERVGYSSASTFSTAFSRHFGQAPGHFAREIRRAAAN